VRNSPRNLVRSHKDTKKVYALKVLNVMRYYYSLRDIQKLLDLPYQTLWKYVNLISVPEERTVDRILSKLEELKILDRLIAESLSRLDQGLVNIVTKPGFLNLFSLITEEFVENARVDLVVPTSTHALLLSGSVAMELTCDICPFIDEALSDRKGYVTTHYLDTQNNEVKFIIASKTCLTDKHQALIIETLINTPDKIAAVVDVLKRFKIQVYGVLTLYSKKEAYESLKALGLKVKSLKTV